MAFTKGQKEAIISFLKALCFIAFFIAIFTLEEKYTYRLNDGSKETIHNSIHKDSNRKHEKFITKDNVVFDVYWVKHTKSHCINPNYPSIHIQTKGVHNAWVNFVTTRVREGKGKYRKKFFIDKDKNNKVYPLYTDNQDFYKAPFQTYSMLFKPYHPWKYRTFALSIDSNLKIIKCIGGITWGFRFCSMRLHPKALKPTLASNCSWQKTWSVLRGLMPDYIDITPYTPHQPHHEEKKDLEIPNLWLDITKLFYRTWPPQSK